MPLVNVLINGHAYTVACDEGEEEHLRDLAQVLDRRVRELVSSVGQVGDARLLLMAGLVVCDELVEAVARADEMARELAVLKEQVNGAGAEREDRLAEALEAAAERVEAIAVRLTQS